MGDLLKLAVTLSKLPVPLVGFVAAVGLLVEKVVSFDQALLLVFVAVGIHYVVIANKHMQVPNGEVGKKPVGNLQRPKDASRVRKTG